MKQHKKNSSTTEYKLVTFINYKLVTFILHGTGIFLVLFYIYPIVPYAPAFFAQFLLS